MVDKDAVAGVIESGAGEWFQIIVLVFGGCCSNVWALESLVKAQPGAGPLLTFAQFLYVTVQTLSSQLTFPTDGTGKRTSTLPRLRKRAVPIRRWMVQVVLFFAVNLMNNYALGLKIQMTVYIIFRSAGLCVSMIAGYLVAGKRYSLGQIAAGAMITTGVIIATMSAPRKRSAPSSEAVQEAADARLYVIGVGLLAVALVVSSLLGLWQEETYARYGKQWREGLFYSHFLSLPFFLPMYSSITTSASAFAASQPMALALPGAPDHLSKILGSLTLPSAFVALAINVVTQGVCVRGVNRLTARVSSTTVNLVLTLRKAVSLAISVWFYGSGVTPGLMIGGALVLVGTVVYSMASSPPKKVIEVPADTVESEKVVEASAVRQNGDLRRRAVR